MGVSAEMQLWFLNSIFVLGSLLFVIGLWIMVKPQSFLKAGHSLSKWVTTDEYFACLDKPRYQERVIYRHHRAAGGIICAGALFTSYMLAFRLEPAMMAASLPPVGDAYWSEWFYGTAYYLLLAANAFAVAVGAVIFLRPSKLKGIEKVLNRWIVSDDRLKKLDESHEISLEVLPGNPRLFGLAVTLGGVYIMLSIGIVLL